MYAAKHIILDAPKETDRFVRCSTCRTSFASASQACPICRGTELLDLHAPEHHTRTQRGVRAYIANLEREHTETVRSMEAILDVLTDAANSESPKRDDVLHLFKEDLQKIEAAVGVPAAFTGNDSREVNAPLLILKQRVSEFRALRRNSQTVR
jgi:hypothetical protein